MPSGRRRFVDPEAVLRPVEDWLDTRSTDWSEEWDVVPPTKRQSKTPMLDRLHRLYDDDVVEAWLTRSNPS